MDTSFESSESDRMDTSYSDLDHVDSIMDSDSDSDTESGNCSDSESDSDTSDTNVNSSSSNDDSDNSDSGSDEVAASGETNNEKSPRGMRKKLTKLFSCDRSRTAHVGSMLKLLREHGTEDIPLCYATLMGTPKYKIVERDVGPGKYFHYGIENNLLKMESRLKNNIFKYSDEIVIDIGIDGATPFNSSKLSIWPIIGAIVNMPHISPFLIGCYAGQGDFHAEDTEEFLKDLCDELEELLSKDISMKCGVKKLVVRLFTMDSPARSKICHIKGHSSHDGCPMCAWYTTVYAGKVVYPNKVGEYIRTDSTFKLRSYLDHHHPEFRNKLSRLEGLGFLMVSQFVIDPMHCIDLGVVLRLLDQLDSMLEVANIDEISRRLIEFKNFRPQEFARDCRSLNLLSKFKATELRQFLLYGSPVFLKGLVSEAIYNHWLLLHVAIRLLANNRLTPNCINVAEKLIEKFVRDYPKIYGKFSVVYNVHVLLHIPYYVRLYGPLDSFSAYKFENFIQRLKKCVLKGNQPLQQIFNRLEERYNNYPESLEISKFNKIKIKSNGNDSYVGVIEDGEIIPVKVIRMERRDRTNYIHAVKCLNVGPLFLSPIDSSAIGEVTYSGISTMPQQFKMSDVQFKYCRIPCGDHFALSPILHSTFKHFDH